MSWSQSRNILPYYGAIVLVIAGMGSILALHLAAPLGKLRRVVEHFGRGNLAVRAGSTRKDEIGELSRAFDDMAIASVRDLGPGVPEALLSDIFKPFFRVEDDRSRASGGLGLGLAIARRAVEVHQGKIAANNGRPGLVITISLPHARAPIKVPSVETFLLA